MSQEIVELLDTINKKEGTTVIMVTHDKTIVNNMKKRQHTAVVFLLSFFYNFDLLIFLFS